MKAILYQEKSQGTGGSTSTQVTLEVHSISELQDRGIPPTDDSPKYQYTADQGGQYSEYLPH